MSPSLGLDPLIQLIRWPPDQRRPDQVAEANSGPQFHLEDFNRFGVILEEEIGSHRPLARSGPTWPHYLREEGWMNK